MGLEKRKQVDERFSMEHLYVRACTVAEGGDGTGREQGGIPD